MRIVRTPTMSRSAGTTSMVDVCEYRIWEKTFLRPLIRKVWTATATTRRPRRGRREHGGRRGRGGQQGRRETCYYCVLRVVSEGLIGKSRVNSHYVIIMYESPLESVSTCTSTTVLDIDMTVYMGLLYCILFRVDAKWRDTPSISANKYSNDFSHVH